MRRALEKVNVQTGVPKSASNPTGDPRLEVCVFNGVCMSVAERDELLAQPSEQHGHEG